jgi:hypothetical protein
LPYKEPERGIDFSYNYYIFTTLWISAMP